MNSPYHTVEIIIETQSSTNALVAAFLPGKIQSGSFSSNGEVLGDNLGDCTITRLRYDEPSRTKLFICPSSSNTRSEDERIQHLCKELNLLPEAARREWDDADLREFYVGYDVDSIEHSYRNQFSQNTIMAAASLKAAIGIVMYAGRNG